MVYTFPATITAFEPAGSIKYDVFEDEMYLVEKVLAAITFPDAQTFPPTPNPPCTTSSPVVALVACVFPTIVKVVLLIMLAKAGRDKLPESVTFLN